MLFRRGLLKSKDLDLFREPPVPWLYSELIQSRAWSVLGEYDRESTTFGGVGKSPVGTIRTNGVAGGGAGGVDDLERGRANDLEGGGAGGVDDLERGRANDLAGGRAYDKGGGEVDDLAGGRPTDLLLAQFAIRVCVVKYLSYASGL